MDRVKLRGVRARYVNLGRMDLRLNDELLEEIYGFKYLGLTWQLIEDVKGMLSIRRLGINVKCPHEGVKMLIIPAV